MRFREVKETASSGRTGGWIKQLTACDIMLSGGSMINIRVQCTPAAPFFILLNKKRHLNKQAAVDGMVRGSELNKDLPFPLEIRKNGVNLSIRS